MARRNRDPCCGIEIYVCLLHFVGRKVERGGCEWRMERNIRWWGHVVLVCLQVCMCAHVSRNVCNRGGGGNKKKKKQQHCSDWQVELDKDGGGPSLAASILSAMFLWQCQMRCLLVPLIQAWPLQGGKHIQLEPLAMATTWTDSVLSIAYHTLVKGYLLCLRGMCNCATMF